MANDLKQNLVWLDLEMSGLDPETCTILEIATIITDSDLNILAEGPNLAVKQHPHVLNSMDDWNTSHHKSSGLIERCLRSQYSLTDCEKVTVSFLKNWTLPGENPLAGNSIGQDRRFLYKYMPTLSTHLNYRSIDVTSFKVMIHKWYPNLPQFQKQEKHLALADIRESIAELEYYRKTVFIA